MNEWLMIRDAGFKLLGVGAFSILYAIGGRGPKWVRRIIAPLILLAVCFFTAEDWDWYYFLPFAWLSFSLHYGYGAGYDETKKLVARTIYGFLLGLTGLALGIMAGSPSLGLAQFVFALAASVYLGILNPVPAVFEETLIGLISVMLIPFML